MVDVNTLQSYLEDIKRYIVTTAPPIIRTVLLVGALPLIDELVMENASLKSQLDNETRRANLLAQMYTE